MVDIENNYTDSIVNNKSTGFILIRKGRFYFGRAKKIVKN